MNFSENNREFELKFGETIQAGGGNDIAITNATYLFYNGYRMDAMEELLASLSSPERADYMFQNAKELKEVDISGVDWSKCTAVHGMFANSGLTRIDLSGCDFALAVGSGMFRGCENLVEIIGVAFPSHKIIDDFFPKGTATKPYKLERLTFKEGVLSCGDIDISYCNMDRDGAIELFSSLSDYSTIQGDELPVQGYRMITLIGNPCVTGTKDTYIEDTERASDINDLYYAMRNNDLEEVTVTTKLGEVKTLTLDQVDEQMADDAVYLTDEEFPVRATITITFPMDCETLTDEDRAIATKKGWKIVEV